MTRRYFARRSISVLLCLLLCLSLFPVFAHAEEIPEGFWAVPVEIGIQDTFNVEIRSGLEEGQEVFTQMQEEDYAFSMF